MSKPRLSREALFTSKDAFGIVGATPVQRAKCRIRDGRPLGDLRDHPDVVAAVGGPEAVAALPSERGIRPIEFYDVSSPRTAKTIAAVNSALVATQDVDVSRLGPGETPRVSIVSLKLDVATVPFDLLIGTVKASPRLRPLLLEAGSDSALFRHPSGRAVEVACVAGGRAAGGLTARWAAGILFDEATRMLGQEDGVVNLDDARTTVLDRLLPGASVEYIGSPWIPAGPVFEAVEAHWGKPTADLVVIRTTGPMGNPKHWTPELCERLRRTNANAYRVGVLGEFIDPVSGLLSATTLKRNTRSAPLELPPEACGACAAALDPSADGFALVIVDTVETRSESGERRSRHRVVLAREWRGGGPEAALREIAELCKRYQIRTAQTDQYAGAANVDLARRFGLHLEVEPWTAPNKLEAFTNMATLTATDSIEFSPAPLLQRDLLSVRKRFTTTGATIEFPRSADGRHADFAPTLALALRHAPHAGPLFSEEALAFNRRVANEAAHFSRWSGMPGRGY